MSSRFAFAGLLLAAALPVAAHTAGSAAAAPPVSEQPAAGRAEPRTEQVVIDEKGSRIEELHVRGEVRSITVRPRNGATAYEIMPATGGRDLANSHSNSRGVAGQRVWSVLNF